jgi:trk system potassium uptake protein TrkA
MRIVVVGASRFGINTASQLIEKGHEVLMIDKDLERLEEIGEQLDCGMIHGDGSLPSIQREAFADHADALLLLTNVDNVNILAAIVGRSVGFERVIPQIVGSELLTACTELGLEDLITPHQTVAHSIVDMLEDEEESTVDLNFGSNMLVRRYWIGDKKAGQRINEMGLPNTCRVLGIVRDEIDKLVSDDTEIHRDDCMIVIVEKDGEEELAAIFDDS